MGHDSIVLLSYSSFVECESDFDRYNMALANVSARQRVGVLVFLLVDKLHVKHVCHVCRNNPQVQFRESLPEADALTSVERQESESVPLFAIRC